MHGKIVELVDNLLDSQRQLAGLTVVKREIIEVLIESTDREIDGLAYRPVWVD